MRLRADKSDDRGDAQPAGHGRSAAVWACVCVCVWVCSSMTATRRSKTGNASPSFCRSLEFKAAMADCSRAALVLRHCRTRWAPWEVRVNATVRLSVAPGERSSMPAVSYTHLRAHETDSY